jgi:hypothetical protein
MANTIDVTQAQYFIPELWAQSAIPFLRANIVAAQRIVRDSEVATFNTGDTLHIPYPGTFTVNDKSANTEFTIQQPSGETEVQLTLNEHREVSFTIEDIVRAESNQDVMARYGEAAAIALAEDVETKVLAELVSGAGSNTVGTYGTNLSFATLLAGWQKLTDNKAPQGQRYAAIATKDAVALAQDSTIANWIAFARPSINVTPQSLGALGGFDDVLSSQLVTAVAGTPVQTKNVGWRRDAALIAYRGMPEPPAGTGARRANVLDPESGIVISVLMGYDIRLGGVQVTYELLYGVKTLQAQKITLIRS